MFDLFTSFLIAISTAMFIKLDGPMIIYNTIIPRYKRLCQLNKLVASQYPNSDDWKKRLITNSTIFCVSMVILSQYLYKNAIQYMNNNIKQIDNRLYEISYIIDGKHHKLITNVCRGPQRILQVSDDKQEDVTDLICPYAGPESNWHGYSFTPLFFKRKSLTFELNDTTEITFFNDEVIKF